MASPYFWAGFGQSLSQGIAQQQEHSLKQQMLDMQKEHITAQNKILQLKEKKERENDERWGKIFEFLMQKMGANKPTADSANAISPMSQLPGAASSPNASSVSGMAPPASQSAEPNYIPKFGITPQGPRIDFAPEGVTQHETTDEFGNKSLVGFGALTGAVRGKTAAGVFMTPDRANAMQLLKSWGVPENHPMNLGFSGEVMEAFKMPPREQHETLQAIRSHAQSLLGGGGGGQAGMPGMLPAAPPQVAQGQGVPAMPSQGNGEGFVPSNLPPTSPGTGLPPASDVFRRVAAQEAGEAGVKAGVEEHNRFMNAGLDASDKAAITGMQNIVEAVKDMNDNFSPEQRTKYVGVLKNPTKKMMQVFEGDPQFAKFQAIMGRIMQWRFGEGGKQLTPTEIKVVDQFVPTATEFSPADFEAKMQGAETQLQDLINRRIEFGTSTRGEILNRSHNKKTSPKNLAAPNAGGQIFETLPPPVQFSGKIATDPATGQKLRSDGTKWIPVK